MGVVSTKAKAVGKFILHLSLLITIFQIG